MCHFQYGFRSSGSTADLPIVKSDRIARAFNKSGATRAQSDILVIFTDFSFMQFPVRYLALFGLFSVMSITKKRPNKAKYLTK